MDLRMPGVDGITVTAHPGVPVGRAGVLAQDVLSEVVNEYPRAAPMVDTRVTLTFAAPKPGVRVRAARARTSPTRRCACASPPGCRS
jgi:hypothetical protein